jgi:hypothetical protein
MRKESEFLLTTAGQAKMIDPFERGGFLAPA